MSRRRASSDTIVPDSSPHSSAATVNQPRPSQQQQRPAGDRREADRLPGGVWRDPIPMKPRLGLLVILLAVFAIWVGLLLAMYFTSLRPDGPHRSRPPRTTAPSLAAALPTDATVRR